MLLNYLKLSLRLLGRNPFFTAINVLGLAVGFSVFLLLWQYSQNELNSDRMWRDWERIARVGFHWSWTDTGKNWEDLYMGKNPAVIGPELKLDFPEIEDVTRILHQSSFEIFSVGQIERIQLASGPPEHRTVLKEEKAAFADKNVFAFFGIPFIYGQTHRALPDGNSICISQSIARKYFGDTNPLGEILTLNDTLPLRVTGVFKDLPLNSHLDFDFVISNENHLAAWSRISAWPLVQTYVKTVSVIKWPDFENKLNSLKDKYWGEIMKSFNNNKVEMLLQPIPDVVFNSTWRGRDFVPKSKPMLNTFSAIGIIVLAVAWANYVNLNLSMAKRRLKELGTRKISGASFMDFAKQFVIEALVINMLSLGLAFTILQVAYRSLNSWFGISLYSFQGTNEVSIFLLLIIIMTGIAIVGIYPAFLAVRYQAKSLFNKEKLHSNRESVVTALTIGQYISAVVLISWSCIMYLQLNHVIKKSRDALAKGTLIIDAPIARSSSYLVDLENFQNQLRAIPGIFNSTASRSVIGDTYQDLVIRSKTDFRVAIDSNGGVDEDFVPLFNFKIIAGRNFRASDRGDVIILSEGAVQRLGFESAEQAVGAKVQIDVLNNGNSWVDVEVIGVIQGYRMRPFLFYGSELDKADRGIGLTYKNFLMKEFAPEKLTLKVEPELAQAALPKVKNAFAAIFPGNVFNWYWLDEHVVRQYNTEKTSRNLVLLFTIVTIGIACLGLLGMMSHKAIEKTKEIGIRKILGARLIHIIYVLLKGTTRHVAVATVIATPLAYYLIREYQSKFSDQIELRWWQLALAFLILVVTMFFTISSVLYSAVKNNPVDALKHE